MARRKAWPSFKRRRAVGSGCWITFTASGMILVGQLVPIADAERESRIGIEKEAIHVIVVDNDHGVGLDPLQPFFGRTIAVEERRPYRVLLHALVIGVRNRRGV